MPNLLIESVELVQGRDVVFIADFLNLRFEISVLLRLLVLTLRRELLNQLSGMPSSEICNLPYMSSPVCDAALHRALAHRALSTIVLVSQGTARLCFHIFLPERWSAWSMRDR